MAYQEIGGARVPVESRYVLKDGGTRAEYGFAVGAGYAPDSELVIDPGVDYSTFLGGASHDSGAAIAVDAAGNAYVTGVTQSPDFPTTPGAFDRTLAGNSSVTDVLVSKLNATGSALVYSTYLGGSPAPVPAGGADPFEFGRGIAIDAAGNAYVAGGTLSPDFPTTPGAFDTSLEGSDAFVSKVNAEGSALVYSTLLGGAAGEGVGGIAVDAADNAWVTGGTSSPDFPVTPGAIDPSFNGGASDAYVTRLDASGSALLESTFLGGATSESGADLALDAAGSVYVAGQTVSADFPTTPGAFDVVFSGDPAIFWADAFVTKLGLESVAPPPLSSVTVNPPSVGGGSSSQGTVTLSAAAPTGGQAVTLSSSNPAVATVPATVTVTGGSTTANFTVSTSPVAASTTVSISGTSGGTTRTATLTVTPAGGGAPGFQSPTTNAADSGGDGNGFETGPANAHGDDALSAADNNSGSGTSTSCTSSQKDRHRFYNYGFSIPTGESITGLEVRLNARADGTSGAPKVCLQLSWDGGTTWTAAKATGTLGTSLASVTLGSATDTWGRTWSAANLTNASFRLRVINVSSSTSRDFFLDWVGVRVHTGAPAPASLSTVSLSPATVIGGNPSTGTVTLTAAAPAGGAVVSLTSSNTAAATVPASVTVAAGAVSASFTAATQAVGASTSVAISATYGGLTRQATLTVNPPATSDTVAIQRAEYDDRDEELRVEATSTWPTNPQNITVRSSLGGSASRNVTLN